MYVIFSTLFSPQIVKITHSNEQPIKNTVSFGPLSARLLKISPFNFTLAGKKNPGGAVRHPPAIRICLQDLMHSFVWSALLKLVHILICARSGTRRYAGHSSESLKETNFMHKMRTAGNIICCDSRKEVDFQKALQEEEKIN